MAVNMSLVSTNKMLRRECWLCSTGSINCFHGPWRDRSQAGQEGFGEGWLGRTKPGHQAAAAADCVLSPQVNLPSAPLVLLEDWQRPVVQGWLGVVYPQLAQHLKTLWEAHWATQVPPAPHHGGQEVRGEVAAWDRFPPTWERACCHLAHAAVRNDTHHAPSNP